MPFDARHPSVSRCARALWVPAAVPVLATAVLYGLTLSPCATPGISARFCAVATGLIPASGSSHALFTCLSRVVAAFPFLTPVLRLNLFSAVCGAFCAGVLYLLVSRHVLLSACEGREPIVPLYSSPETAIPEQSSVEIECHNKRVRRIALWSGFFCAAVFGCSAPVWAASTHLDRGPFDLLLALVALRLLPCRDDRWAIVRLWFSVFVFSLGLFESAAFLLLLPVFGMTVLLAGVYAKRRILLFAGAGTAVVLGLGLHLAAFRMIGADSGTHIGTTVIRFLRANAGNLLHELRMFFPLSGWLLLVLQVGLASLLLLFAKRILFNQKTLQTVFALLFLVVTVTPTMLNLPGSPYRVFSTDDHLPVFASALLAVAAAIALAAALISRVSEDRAEPDESYNAMVEAAMRRIAIVRYCSVGCLVLLFILMTVMPFRNYPEVRAAQGAFADAAADEVLASMKGRVCLITNGQLDHHLRLRALTRGQLLAVVDLRTQMRQNDGLRTWINQDPLFDGLNRVRLQNALAISPVRFVTEWLKSDPHAAARILMMAAPELWVACGYRAIPEGLAFGGMKEVRKSDLGDIAASGYTQADRLVPLFAVKGTVRHPRELLREALRMKLGFGLNELGVLLEDFGENESAYDAYTAAVRTDAQNISAVLNLHALAVSSGLHPEKHELFKKRVKTATSDSRYQMLGWGGILQTYGTIRHSGSYVQEARRWSASGSRVVAESKIRKALDLVSMTGAAAAVERGFYHEQLGDLEQADACYRIGLKSEDSRLDAMRGLFRLALIVRNADAAHELVRQMRGEGAGEETLRDLLIDLALLTDDLPQARKLLVDATASHPQVVRYWNLLANVMIRQGDDVQVQQALLPSMQKALPVHEHYLAYAIRGSLLCRKGTDKMADGRQLLLRALVLNPNQPAIWDTLLVSDMAQNRTDWAEADARFVLGLDPEHALANYLAGSRLLAQGQLLEAEDHLSRSLSRHESPLACNDLAETLRLLGRPREAEGFARKALALNDKLIPVYDTLANILIDLGRAEDAVGLARQACGASDVRPSYQLTLLRALLMQGDPEAIKGQIEQLQNLKIEIPKAFLSEESL